MHRLISVLRRPGTIVAVVSERASPFSLQPRDGYEAGYGERVEPLAATSDAVCPFKEKDVKAWRALARVPSLGERAGLAIVRAIIGSVADPDTPVDGLPALSFEAGAVDLRPYLCAADSEQMLLGRIGSVLDEVAGELDFPDWHWKRRHDIAALPPAFRRYFLWGLHLSPWAVVRLTLAVFDQLELETDHALCRAVARLLSLAERSLGIAWCEVIAEIDSEERVRATEVILESGGHRREPTPEIRRALSRGDWSGAFEMMR